MTTALNSGYLKCFTAVSPSKKASEVTKYKFVERYAELVGRKLSLFTSKGMENPCIVYDVLGFCKWTGDEYGLELKTSTPNQNILVAAFNRLDLEKWSRGILAAVDPNSEAASELRRQRRRARKLVRKEQELEDSKRNALREREKKLREIEYLKRIQREEEVQLMTPLERSDGLGSLDQSTEKVLQRRKVRKQRRYMDIIR